MGSITDKLKGATNQVIGAVKEAAGHAVGNPTFLESGAAPLRSLRETRRRSLATPRMRSRRSSTRRDREAWAKREQG